MQRTVGHRLLLERHAPRRHKQLGDVGEHRLAMLDDGAKRTHRPHSRRRHRVQPRHPLGDGLQPPF
eukprot:2005484-Lingulodinium_polyedra.AAC.1